jgi:phage/plasmid-associated DNA primase
VATATQKFRDEADPVRGFIAERVRRAPEVFTARADLYMAYQAWATVNGFSALSASRFYESLGAASELPLEYRVRQGIRGYVGIAV